MVFKRRLVLAFVLLTGCATVTGGNDKSATTAAALTLPFKLRGHSGTVSVRYEANQDPVHWGFDLLNLSFDIEQTRGFPVFDARTRYDSEGLRAIMGGFRWSPCGLATVNPSGRNMIRFRFFARATLHSSPLA